MSSVTYVLTGSWDKTIKLWEVLRGQCLWTFMVVRPSPFLHSFSTHLDWAWQLGPIHHIHPTGKHLISAADNSTCWIWVVKTRRCVRQIEAHEKFVSCIAWGWQAISSNESEKDKVDAEKVARVMNAITTGNSDQVGFSLLSSVCLRHLVLDGWDLVTIMSPLQGSSPIIASCYAYIPSSLSSSSLSNTCRTPTWLDLPYH
jgi:WD40 repeat protein